MSYKMRRSFKLDNKKYTWIPSELFDISKLKLSKEKFRYNILKIGCAFDIETTSYYSAKYDKDLATMYVWQLGLNKDTIMGRTWGEFVRVLEIINKYAEENEGKIICLIQNFSFEFQFLKSLLQWNRDEKTGYPDIFAKDDRTILYARYKNIEFRDTLALTGMGLNKFQKNYNLDVGKLSGDLDYSLMRHCKSNITDRERAYCINDVQVLTDFFHKYLFTEYIRHGKKIPLTMTGEVRLDIKEEFNQLPKEEKKKLLAEIRRAQPSETVYKFWRNYLFRGGLVHASTIMCNHLFNAEFESDDLKSAHPSHMLHDPFPYKFNRRNKSQFPKILEEARSGKYGFFGVFKFYNIRCSGFHSLESKNKIIQSSPDVVYENGRLVYASYIKVALIELDWFNYEDMYSWDSFECTVIYQAKLKPLPDYVRKTICKYFVIKETQPKDTAEYSRSKRRLNSVFGMASTGLPEREVVYNPETNEMELSEISKTYNELIQYLIMLPQWAIYTTAYTRRDIVKSIVGSSNAAGCGADSIYYDTDSNKILNPELHKEFFDNFNAEKMEKNRNMDIYGYDFKYFERLGCFEKEYTGTRFKVLGAKRYLVEHDGKTQVTIAGCVKGSLEEYCEKNNLDIWEEFTDGLKLPAGDSKKKTTVYYDKPFEDILTDYNGITEKISEGSCVAIIDIPFTMSIEEEFINRIETLAKEREKYIYKGFL